jgi:hypothetical protein
VPTDQQAKGARGVVVAHVAGAREHVSDHERATLLAFARQLAQLKGFDPGGFYDPSTRYTGPLYFVPSCTLTLDEADALGIRGVDDLFGGVVPHAFVATKAISHPLVRAGAATVAGWDPDLAERMGDAVLAGYSAFTHEDARAAGLRLLASGPVRLKPVHASGGRGQSVARDEGELQSLLAGMDAADLARGGVVLEEDMSEVATFSVGQVRVAELTATYFGVQKLTPNQQGQQVFGGSDLTVARGGFDALLQLDPAPDIRHAIEQARRYDAAVRASFPGFFASRSNYDVLLGRDAAGRERSAVLEQSWRAGGATGPELAALEVFRKESRRASVRTTCVEIFGDSPEPPAHATVYFRGTDSRLGRLTKYTVVEADVDAG